MSTTIEAHGLVAQIDGESHLVGGRCPSCDSTTFPMQRACARCGDAMDEAVLPDSGTVWSWTVQRLRPKPPYRGPEEFDAYALGYVDLGPVRVESRLAGKPVDAWSIGDAVVLVVGAPNDDGDVWSFHFEPRTTAP